MLAKIRSILSNKYVRFGFAATIYILWVIWLGNFWWLFGLIVIFDIYISKKVNWSFWKSRKKKNSVFIEWLDALIFAVIAVTIINIFLFQNYKIPTPSMEKSLLIGDHLYVSKVSYGPRVPNTPLSFPFTSNTMRRGTEKHTYAEINEITEAVAASVYVNTGRHLTGFGGKSLAEDFNLLVEMMIDNLLCPTFPVEEVEKLRGQIITDLKEDEDDTRGMAGRYFREILYTFDHAYGRPLDGTLESIPNLTRDDLLDFYHRLHPQAGAVVVVGDVTGQAVYETLEAVLGRWQPGHTPPETTLPPPRPLVEKVQHLHPMENKSQTDIVLGWVGPDRRADDFYAAYVGNTIGNGW